MTNCVIFGVIISIVFYLESSTALDILPRAPECGVLDFFALDAHPWVVLIEYSKPNNKKSFVCSGVLINKRYVVTTAHCVSGKNIPSTWTLSVVRLGEHDLLKEKDCVRYYNEEYDSDDYDSEEDCSPPVVDLPISEKIVHELYDPLSKNGTNDIALLRLESDVIFTNFVKPICLPRDSKLMGFNYDNVALGVGGWYRHTDEDSIKQVGQVMGINNTECNQRYRHLNVSLQDSQLCVKVGSGFPCDSFSGTPIMRIDNHDRDTFWYLAGLVSFGNTPCGMKDALPVVATRIDSYVDWIESKVYA